MILKELLKLNEVTGDKNFDAKMKKMTGGKSVLPDDEVRDTLKKASEPKEVKLTGAVAKFDKWYSNNDLWHPRFPTRFADCVEAYIKGVDEDVLEMLGELVADHAHSFYGEDMLKLIDYIKRRPIPDRGEDEGQDAYYTKLGSYVEKALKDMHDQ